MNCRATAEAAEGNSGSWLQGERLPRWAGEAPALQSALS